MMMNSGLDSTSNRCYLQVRGTKPLKVGDEQYARALACLIDLTVLSLADTVAHAVSSNSLSKEETEQADKARCGNCAAAVWNTRILALDRRTDCICRLALEAFHNHTLHIQNSAILASANDTMAAEIATAGHELVSIEAVSLILEKVSHLRCHDQSFESAQAFPEADTVAEEMPGEGATGNAQGSEEGVDSAMICQRNVELSEACIPATAQASSFHSPANIAERVSCQVGADAVPDDRAPSQCPGVSDHDEPPRKRNRARLNYASLANGS